VSAQAQPRKSGAKSAHAVAADSDRAVLSPPREQFDRKNSRLKSVVFCPILLLCHNHQLSLVTNAVTIVKVFDPDDNVAAHFFNHGWTRIDTDF
jgi:hypothetical protein